MVKRTSTFLMTFEALFTVFIVAATAVGCDGSETGSPGGSGGAMPGTGGTTFGTGGGGAVGAGGAGSGGLMAGGNGGTSAGGNRGTGGGSGGRACEQVECLRPYECVRSCGGPIEYSGCCPCEAPLFDNFINTGCGGAVGSGGGTGAGGGVGGNSGGGHDAGGDVSPACWIDAGAIAPEAKACEQDSDCMMTQSTPCCGSPVIVGLSKQAEAYAACYQSTCPPGLGCAIGLPVAEDGQAATLDSAEVHCVAQGGGKACATNAPRGNGGPGSPCMSVKDCSAGLSCCYPCGIAGCENQCMQTSNGSCPLYP